MRLIFALSVLLVAPAAEAGATQPVPEVPPAPLKSPSETELDALIAEAGGRNPQAADKAARKLVALGPVAVPALAQGLWADATTRRTCVLLLGTIGADARAAAPSLIRLLADEAPEVRYTAARALGSVGAHAAAPALAKLLDDKAPQVRLVAAEALIALGADAGSVIPALTKALKSDQPEEAHAAAKLFAELGPEAAPAVPALNDRLAGADPLLTALVCDALARIGPAAKDALPALKAKLNEDTNLALYRASAALALWRVSRDPNALSLLRDALAGPKGRVLPHPPLWRIDQSKETVDALARELKSDDPAKALAAARVLGARSKEALPALPALPALLKLLKAEDPSVQLDAALMLGEFGPDAKEGLDLLQRIAEGKARGASVPAAVAVYRIAPSAKAARVLTDYLEDKTLGIEAAEALKELRPANQAVALELVAALDGPDEYVQLASAVALWRIEKNARALPAATKLLRSNDPQVRATAATDLGAEFGPDAKPAVPDLAKRLFDPFAAVRSASAEALGRVGPDAKAAVRPLLALLDGDEPGFVHSAACEALGLIRPEDKDAVVATLKAKLKSSDALVRAHAALALLRVAGDKSGAQEVETGLTWRTHPVRITAAEAAWLANKDARTVPLLIRALEESNLEGTGSENERYMAARALGRVGADAKDAVPELTKLVNHRDHALATAARTALKAIDPAAAAKAGVK